MKIYEKIKNEKEKTYIMVLEEYDSVIYTKIIYLRKIQNEWITTGNKLYTMNRKIYNYTIKESTIVEE